MCINHPAFESNCLVQFEVWQHWLWEGEGEIALFIAQSKYYFLTQYKFFRPNMRKIVSNEILGLITVAGFCVVLQPL